MSYYIKKGLMMQGVAAVGFVPLDADVLSLHTKVSPILYRKNLGGIVGFAYRDINYIDDSEISYNANATEFNYFGFYNKTLAIGPIQDFDYSIHERASLSRLRILERGVLKFSVLPYQSSTTKRLKKIINSCEYYINDVLKYTSLQSFSGGQFGLMIVTLNQEMDNVMFKV